MVGLKTFINDIIYLIWLYSQKESQDRNLGGNLSDKIHL